jgi:hypothetical protein
MMETKQPKSISLAVLFIFDGMKRFCFLLLVYGLVTFHASAQTHFITAGQTQGMIFTDYVPDYHIPTLQIQPNHSLDSGKIDIDINHDLITDFTISCVSRQSLGGGGITYKIYPSNQSYILTKVDFGHGNGGYIDTTPQMVAKKLLYNDTIAISSDSLWSNSTTTIFVNGGNGANNGTLTDFSLPLDSPCWYAAKVIKGTDTLIGYLHFLTKLSAPYQLIYDFACEGPTSSYIITSTNNLSPTNISISPNPFTNQINIGTDKAVEYQVTDYTGRVLLSGKTERSISTEMLPPGSYLLLLKNEELYSVKKMVKY